MIKLTIPNTWYWRGNKKHLVSEIMDGDEPIVVSKSWSHHKQRWVYHAEQKFVAEYEVMLARRIEDEEK